jgi:hypothetical protein
LIRPWHDGAVTSARDNTNGDGLPRVPSIPLTDDAAYDTGNQSIGHLVKDATAQLSTLVRAEIELARSEIAKEVKNGLSAGVFFIIALVIVLFGVLPYLFITIALALNEALPAWAEPWGGFFIMFVVMALLAFACFLLGRRKVKKIKAPERTIDSFRDTAAALTRRNGEPGTELSTDVASTTPARTS